MASRDIDSSTVRLLNDEDMDAVRAQMHAAENQGQSHGHSQGQGQGQGQAWPIHHAHHNLKNVSLSDITRSRGGGFRLVGPGVLVLVLCLLSVSYYMTRTLSISLAMSHGRTCPDPYSLPGFFLHSATGGESGRWIPYTKEVLEAQGPAEIPETRDDTRVPKQVAALATPDFYDALRQKSKRGSNPDLDFLRGRTVVIQGCSLDRYVLFGYCKAVGGELRTSFGDRSGLHACTIPEFDFDIQMWFNYGATYIPGKPDSDRVPLRGPTDFETRIKKYYRPQMKREGLDRKPDLMLYASGTWDVTTLRYDYYHEENDKGLRAAEEAMSWQELAFHRKRLLEMKSFLEKEWPGVPVMYRPPTYPVRAEVGSGWKVQGNETDVDFLVESTYRIHESAKALAATHDFPLFTWAEKLIGHHEYISRNHFRENAPVTQLYIDMLLYYLKHHTVAGRSHCTVQQSL